MFLKTNFEIYDFVNFIIYLVPPLLTLPVIIIDKEIDMPDWRITADRVDNFLFV